MIQKRNNRVFVGVNDSLVSLQALRLAAREARQHHAELHLVHVRHPANPNTAARVGVLGQPIPAGFWDPNPRDADRLNAQAMQIMTSSLNKALGGTPADLEVHYTVLVGNPATELASLGGGDDDLLVVGTDGGRRWHHLRRRSISRYCATHSRSATLIVPRTELTQAVQHRLMSHRTRLPRDPWKEFDATSHSSPRSVL